ncbi:TolC family protein [Hymenobacter sp. 15J16-1T3B]|uniref:TolC family protein n=1 Tax=Hymenobacter sp. 15J16-1T3B TaxID=2886941 RepID=UPI001D12C392|nr:TolC family protein [Hymenobacter sp. 15J16-1T3B]MCC3158399.1 TolC family protein [Hymenobacter sp. 15J16-1T3B]
MRFPTHIAPFRSLLPAVALLLPLAAAAQQPGKAPAKAPNPGSQLAQPQTVAPGTPLSLEEAIRLGLENNYGIRIARRDEEIVRNNVTRGNAGQLPTVSGNLSRTFNINYSRQQLNNTEPRLVSGGKANALGVGLGLNWTIFDGLGMFIAYDRLRTLDQQQQQVTRATVEQAVADITDAYYTVVRERGKIRAFEEALKVGQARIDLTQAQVDVGVTAKVELLTAQVDYNADRALLIQQQEALATAKTNLNNLLGRAPSTDMNPADSIVVNRALNKEQVVAGIVERNPVLQQARLGVDVATLERKQVAATRLPQVDVVGGYNLNRNINNAAFINTPQGSTLATNTNRVYGPNYGVVASVPIFDGFNRRRLEQNARVNIERSKLQLDQAQLDLNTQAEQAFLQYQNRLQLLDLEESNIQLARQNVAITLERYRLGLLNQLSLREAQRNLLDAENRLLDARFLAKQAEVVLRQLSGDLVQQPPGAPK